jgi:hypothetical protein
MKKPWKPSVEDGVQMAIVAWIEACAPQCFVFSIANEFKSSALYGHLLNRKGRKKGMPDLCVLVPAMDDRQERIFFIEVKAPKKGLRDDQVDMKKRLDDLGFLVHVASTIEDVDYIFSALEIPTRCTSS